VVHVHVSVGRDVSHSIELNVGHIVAASIGSLTAHFVD